MCKRQSLKTKTHSGFPVFPEDGGWLEHRAVKDRQAGEANRVQVMLGVDFKFYPYVDGKPQKGFKIGIIHSDLCFRKITLALL